MLKLRVVISQYAIEFNEPYFIVQESNFCLTYEYNNGTHIIEVFESDCSGVGLNDTIVLDSS